MIFLPPLNGIGIELFIYSFIYLLKIFAILNKSSKLFLESEDRGCSLRYFPRKRVLELSSNSVPLNFRPSYKRVELEWNAMQCNMAQCIALHGNVMWKRVK